MSNCTCYLCGLHLAVILHRLGNTGQPFFIAILSNSRMPIWLFAMAFGQTNLRIGGNLRLASSLNGWSGAVPRLTYGFLL